MNFKDAKNLRIVTGYLEDPLRKAPVAYPWLPLPLAYQFSQQLAAVRSAPRLGYTSPGETRKMAGWFSSWKILL
jgi:hypothetical protein